MDRGARLSLIAAAFAFVAAPAFALPRTQQGDPIFVPSGPPVVVHHIGMVGTGCDTTAGVLRIEALTDSAQFRISNPTPRSIVLRYDWDGSFGDYQMFFIRIADGEGELVGADARGCGWWSPKINQAMLYPPGRYPRRRVLTIPARGYRDIPIDVPALTYWWPFNHSGTATGPCTMQVRLFGYRGPRTWEPVTAETGWFPVACPASPPPPRADPPGSGPS